VPVLANILRLASFNFPAILDFLSGKPLAFDEFKMLFENTDNLITINEIYSIGPAISVLMEGYIEKDRLVSLRGTLVPATTINKLIKKAKVLGDILIGSKKGEGVFGVSFKIKGPPKDLKTSVNPIKTLTPRFITRTLEKIKKQD
jgi:Predicted membrane protein